MGEMVREENPVRPCGVTKAAAAVAVYWPVVVLMAWNNADNDEDHLLQALRPVLLQPFFLPLKNYSGRNDGNRTRRQFPSVYSIYI